MCRLSHPCLCVDLLAHLIGAPVNTGVQGVGGMEAGAAQPFLPIAPTPWCLFGFFLGIQKETRRRGGEIPFRASRSTRKEQNAA